MFAAAGEMEQSDQTSLSTWMSHWTRRISGEVVRSFDQSTDIFEKKETGHDTSRYQPTSKLETAVPNVSNPTEGLTNNGSRNRNLENDSLKMTLTSLRNEHQWCPSFYEDGHGKISGTSKVLKRNRAAFNVGSLQHQDNHYMGNDSARGLHSNYEAQLKVTNDCIKTPTLFGDVFFPTSRPVEDWHHVQSDFNNGCGTVPLFPSLRDKTALKSIEQLPPTSLRHSKCEDFKCSSHSSILVCEEKSRLHSKSVKYMPTCFLETTASPLQANPSTSNNWSLGIGENSRKIRNFSGPTLVHNWSKLPVKNNLEKLDNGFNRLSRFQSSINQVETTRICTTVDSVGVSGGHSRFSPTTHSSLISEKTLLKADQTYEKSRGRADFDMHPFSNINSLPSQIEHVQHAIKFGSLHGFIDSEVEENSNDVSGVRRYADGNVKYLDNFSMDINRKKVVDDSGSDLNLDRESLCDTAIVDLDNFKEKTQVHDVHSSPAAKVIKLGSVTPRLDLCLGGVGDGAKLVKTKRPGINLELPTSSAEENMVAFEEPSTSITRSLYMETVAAHAKQVRPSVSDYIRCGSVKPEPGARWIKRLILNDSSSYSVGAKSSNSREGLPHEKISPERISNGCMASSEPAANMTHCKELRLLNKTTTLKPCGKSASATKKDGELLLSESWIKRWCHRKDANPEKNHDAEVVSEPKSSKLLFEDTEKKQFPSIAAMALMAKAMNGFQPCDIQKTGAFAVWNTRQLK